MLMNDNNQMILIPLICIQIESDIPIYKVGQRVFLIDNFYINSNILLRFNKYLRYLFFDK